MIVSRFWLGEKIKKLFPNIKLIFSSIGSLIEPWDEKYLFENFDIVVCPIQEINNFTFIKDQKNYRKLEIFLNNECVNFNNKCYNHYLHNSLYNNGLIENSIYSCPFINKKQSSLATININKYIQLGVKHLKLIERTSLSNNYDSFINLLRKGIKK